MKSVVFFEVFVKLVLDFRVGRLSHHFVSDTHLHMTMIVSNHQVFVTYPLVQELAFFKYFIAIPYWALLHHFDHFLSLWKQFFSANHPLFILFTTMIPKKLAWTPLVTKILRKGETWISSHGIWFEVHCPVHCCPSFKNLRKASLHRF